MKARSRRQVLAILLAALFVGSTAAWLFWPRDRSRDIAARESRLLERNPAALHAIDQAQHAADLAHLKDAERGFSMVLRLEPRSALAHLNLGLVLARQGRKPEALKSLQAAARLQPDWSVVWWHLARVYTDVGQLAPAEDAVARAIRLSPNAPEAWLERAHLYLLKGDFRLAEESARAAVARGKERPETWLSLGDVVLKRPGRELHPEAIPAFRKAIALAPTSYAYRRLGEAQGRAGAHGEAVSSLKEAVRLEPYDANAAWQLSLALQANKQVKEGERWAARSRQLEDDRYMLATLERRAAQVPGDSDLQARLGALFARCGEFRLALDAYRKAAALDPDDERVREALARLEAGGGP